MIRALLIRWLNVLKLINQLRYKLIIMAKRKIILQETFVKGALVAKKEDILEVVNNPDSILFIDSLGKYDDGKEFMTITIES